MQELATIEFHGDKIHAVMNDDEMFVNIKSISDKLGLNWRTQRKKITSKRWGHMVHPFKTKGGIQEMICIPLKKLNGWLFSINSERVTPEIKEALETYQDECSLVLYDYFAKGGAINPRANEEQIEKLQSELESAKQSNKNLETACIQRDGVIAYMSQTMAPFSPVGTISEVNGKPRQYQVKSYYRSDKGHLVDDMQAELFNNGETK